MSGPTGERVGAVTVVEQGRLDAVRALRDFVSTKRGRQTLLINGYEQGTPVIPATDTDTIELTMARIRATGAPKVVVAVHFPSRRDIELLELRSAENPGTDHIETRGGSTIGMLVDAIQRAARGATFSVSSEVVAHRFDPQPA